MRRVAVKQLLSTFTSLKAGYRTDSERVQEDDSEVEIQFAASMSP